MIEKIVLLLLMILPQILFSQEPGYRSTGQNGIVAGSERAPVQAGLEMLKAGGNAADAATATASGISGFQILPTR
jgi:gamma-glutamyltranspeptidase